MFVPRVRHGNRGGGELSEPQKALLFPSPCSREPHQGSEHAADKSPVPRSMDNPSHGAGWKLCLPALTAASWSYGVR